MRWQAACAALAASAAFAAAGAAAPRGKPQQRNRGAIRVETNLVEILASVTDANGEPVADLKQDAFHLSEDGVPQKIVRFEAQTGQPLDLALMIDSSMSETGELKTEGEAAGRFIQKVVRPGDTLAVFEFSDSVVRLSPATDRIAELQKDAMKMTPGAGTCLYDAVLLGSDALRALPAHRRRVIVLVTDAGETTSDSTFDQARHAAIASGALLYSIIIRAIPNENGRNTAGEHALDTITDSTGGALFTLFDMKKLDATFERINRELRTQYLLGYYPNPIPPPGSDRHVQLDANGNYVVRYRKEYFTQPAGAP